MICIYQKISDLKRLDKIPCPPVAALICFMISSMEPDGRAVR